jgi:hypothetical protein
VATGPKAIPAPSAAPHWPLARARSTGVGDTCATMPRLEAMIPAAPMPLTTRPVMNSGAAGAIPHARLPSANAMHPPTKARRRP